ncbi:hypothetical protein JCM8547_008039 [Rhodosporidiobolus lusitaniae]
MNAHHKKRSYRPPPPKSHARSTSGSFAVPSSAKLEGEETNNKLRKAAERIPFGWQLDALVPAVGSSLSTAAAEEVQRLVKEHGAFYLCEGVTLADLLEVEFLNGFVRKGSLVALSLNDSEEADIVAIDGRGRLVLSVPKETYELLGLPGRASAHGSLRQRFIIEISLVDPSFRLGKPGFERVKQLLRDWPIQTDLFDALAGVGTNGVKKETTGKTFDVAMSYTDEKGLSQPITFPSTISATLHYPTLTSHTLPSTRIPLSSSFPPSASSNKRPRTSSGAFRKTKDEPQLFWEDYREWAGLVRLGAGEKVAWRDGEEEEEKEWGLPLEACEKGEVTALSWTGMLHPRVMGRVLDEVAKNPIFASTPFLSLALRPFPHAPLSHLSAASPPVVGTSKKPNGKKRKRGRGRGEEEEANKERMGEDGGWEVVLRRREGEEGKVEYSMWEGQ